MPAGFFLSESDNFIFLFYKADNVYRLVFCACKRIFHCRHIWYNYVSSVFNVLVTNESATAKSSPSSSAFGMEIIAIGNQMWYYVAFNIFVILERTTDKLSRKSVSSAVDTDSISPSDASGLSSHFQPLSRFARMISG